MIGGSGGRGEGRNDWYAISPYSFDMNDPALFSIPRISSAGT